MLREVTTKYGKIKGLPAADPRITSFKGIPFAKPPVGDLRWRAPQKPDSWDGVLEAYTFAPISVQDRPAVGTDIYCREWHVDPDVEISEDCLYLNVWTPAKKTDEKLPVLVWYFGGGLQWGYPSEMEFDGERLARRGVIVVTVNYRLNIFGFFAQNDLIERNPNESSNFGYLDQQAGTRWVKENIAAFGGDPENITIAGQSAGGGSVMSQITNLENEGLFNKAIVLSGIICSPYFEAGIPAPMNKEEACKWSEGFFELLGVKTIDEARKIDKDTILGKYNEYVATHPRLFGITDGVFIKDDPVKRALNGQILDIPIMAGNTADEFLNFIDVKDDVELADKAKNIYGTDAEVFLKYPEVKEFKQDNHYGVISGIELSVKALFEARKKNGSKNDFYYYRFNTDIPGDDHPGNFHSCDLWFFFETLAKCSRAYVGHHYDLARQMANYFTNFIKCGNPNGLDADMTPMPLWMPYTEKDRCEIEFNSKGSVPMIEKNTEYKSYLRTKIATYKLNGVCKKQAFNPYLPSYEFVPDGEPYVFGDRIYVYGSHDFYNGDVFCLGDYVCWSAPVDDPGNFRYDGVIYRKEQEPTNVNGEGMLYAPDMAVGSDGRYYLYYTISNMGNVSVAVCDTPNGKFEFYGHVHYPDGTSLGEREGDEPQFDPGVLKEGKVTYLYTGFCGRGDKSRHGSFCTVLDDDMLTVIKDPVLVVPGCEYSEGTGFEGHEYFEAASIRKMNGKYIFVYSSVKMHELCYAVSDKPDSGFKYCGVIISNGDLGIDSYKDPYLTTCFGANNHGSIVQMKNDWYIFYHRHTNGTWYSRQGCAEKLDVDESTWTIKQAEVTSCGLNDGPLKAEGYYPAYIACNLFYQNDESFIRKDNEAIQPDITKVKIVKDGGDGDETVGYITNFNNNAVVGFKYFDFKDVKKISIWVHGYAHGTVSVKTALDGDAVGSAEFNSNNFWLKVDIPVNIENGVHPLYFVYEGGGNASFKGFTFND